MKSKKPYLPITLVVGVVGVLLLASFPPKWFAQSQEPSPTAQQQTQGPQPDVGETVLVPKKVAANSIPAVSRAADDHDSRRRSRRRSILTIVYTLSTTTSLVNVDVMVVDNNGSPLQNLEKRISSYTTTAFRKPSPTSEPAKPP